ncbi:MAG: chloride channel protein [Cyclobacteriaceae bacterium]
MAVVVGLCAGFVAILLKATVHYLQSGFSTLHNQYPWIYAAAPSLGILITIGFTKLILNNQLQKGTYHVLLAIGKKSSQLPRSEVYSHAVTSALTVGAGGSAGLESPIVQTGSAIGSNIASLFPLGYKDRTLLLACGASAGIASAFNAPIAGVLFALEVLLVDVSISSFIPLLMAGATGALLSKIALSEEILLSFKEASPFNYFNIPYYIILGILCGVASVYYIRVYLSIENLFERFSHWSLKWCLGGALLAILIYLFPPLFGEGYATIRVLSTSDAVTLFSNSPFQALFSQSSLWIGISVLLISLLKVLAVSFSINAGGNGGNFAPALTMGSALGFSYAYITNSISALSLPTSNFSLVAMAGVLTGIFHAPLTAIFLIAEITGGYDLMIPLMIVAAISTSISRYFGPHSLDDAKLIRAKALTVSYRNMQVISGLAPSDFLEKDFVTISEKSTLRELIGAIEKSKRNVFPVVDGNDRLVGIISLEEIRGIMFSTSLYDSIKVTQLMHEPTLCIDDTDDIYSIMDKFDKTDMWNIPVRSGEKYKGFMSKSTVYSKFRELSARHQ